MEKRESRRLPSEALWAYALKLLAARAHSTGELREKLNRRAERPEDVEPALARLKDLGYLDDRRYAAAYAAARLVNDRLGRARVERDLRRRRVAPALAERAARQAYEGIDEQTLIEEWIRRKYRQAPREGLFAGEKDLAAAYRRMLRAGFSTAVILRALRKFAKNPELLDDFEPPEPGNE